MMNAVLHNPRFMLAWLLLKILVISAGFTGTTGCSNKGAANKEGSLSGTVITENNIAAKVYVVSWDDPQVVLDSAITLREFEFASAPEQSWMIIAQDSNGNMAWAGPFMAEEQPDLKLEMRPAQEKELELPELPSTLVFFHQNWQNTPALQSRLVTEEDHLHANTANMANTVDQIPTNRWLVRWPESEGRMRLWIQRDNSRPYYIWWNGQTGEPEIPVFHTSPVDSLVYSWILEYYGLSSNQLNLSPESGNQNADLHWVAADSSWRIRARPLEGTLFLLEQQWPVAEGWNSLEESWSLHFSDSLHASPYAFAGGFAGTADSFCIDDCYIEELVSSNESTGLIRTFWSFQSADSSYRMTLYAKNRVWILQGNYSDQGELRKLSFDFHPAASDQLLRMGLLWSADNQSDTLKATGFAHNKPFPRFWWVQESDSLYLQPYHPATTP